MAKATSQLQGRGALTAKGRATRAAILDAAHQVFKEKGFYGSSVSEVTRRCGVSTATFYQYFKNKDQVFQELNDRIINRFTEKTAALDLEGLPFEKRLRAVLRILFEHCRENLAFHTALGESELIDSVTVAYYESIARYYRHFFRLAAQSGDIRPLDPDILAYGLVGICYFHSLGWPAGEEGVEAARVVDFIMDFVLRGLDGPAPWNRPQGADLLELPEPAALRRADSQPLTKGEKTRRSIFTAAEEVIGRRGINRANIFEITRQAGVAQGTFYVHFESKHELIEGFVKYFNHEMRAEVQRFVGRTTDRRDAERVGILTFFDFVRRHRQIYRIIPECEIISRDVSLWYYGKIARGYVKGLKRGIERGEIRDLPPVFLARSLMGLIHFIGLKWIIWPTGIPGEIPDPLLADILRLVMFGLASPTDG